MPTVDILFLRYVLINAHRIPYDVLQLFGSDRWSKLLARRKIEKQVEVLTLEQLETAIFHAKFGWENGGSSQGRRAFFKSLVSFEAQREALFNIEAPRRRYNR